MPKKPLYLRPDCIGVAVILSGSREQSYDPDLQELVMLPSAVMGSAAERLAVLGQVPDAYAGLMCACQEFIGGSPAKSRYYLPVAERVEGGIILEVLSHGGYVG